MRRRSKSELRAHKARMGSACADALPEKYLRLNLESWKKRLHIADTPEYYKTCQSMIRYYEERIDRLGVRLTCAD